MAKEHTYNERFLKHWNNSTGSPFTRNVNWLWYAVKAHYYLTKTTMPISTVPLASVWPRSDIHTRNWSPPYSSRLLKLITCPNILYNDVRSRLLEKLIEVAPANLTQAYLCNSGTEANEAALKFARLQTGRPNFVTAMRGFHGRTMGSVSATFTKKYREAFEPLVPRVQLCAFK